MALCLRGLPSSNILPSEGNNGSITDVGTGPGCRHGMESLADVDSESHFFTQSICIPLALMHIITYIYIYDTQYNQGGLPNQLQVSRCILPT